MLWPEICDNGVIMSEETVGKPLYLLIANWVMAQNRWVSAKEIASEFDIPHCKAINTMSYILSQVGEIVCETKTIPNQLEGRGCQCQRLVKVKHIDSQIHARFQNSPQNKEDVAVALPRQAPQLAGEMNREQKWQMMLSKTLRR
ncbi:carnitine metabolism transcriptional regulator CaiF [Atlantibacter sp. RC6]|uniref:carnitine metabolism transcriptional regulator CaiF n=1 Tax=Atlantibacter sp. RC6 TaxID=2587036 RepID=UPI00351ACFB4